MSDGFDLRVISLGAGVQSTALYRMAVMEIVGPKPDFAILQTLRLNLIGFTTI